MSATVAFATADESSDWAPAAVPMKLKVGTTFFGKSENRRPKKFLWLSGVSHRKGVGLALGSRQINSNYNALKAGSKNNAGLCGRGLKLFFDFQKGGWGCWRPWRASPHLSGFNRAFLRPDEPLSAHAENAYFGRKAGN